MLGCWYSLVGEPELLSNEDIQVVNAKAFVDTTRAGGFTLLEVMVAVAIMAIALVAILKANVQSLDTLIETRARTTASMLAASKMAEVEAAGAEDWSEFRGDFGEDYPGFTWQVETTPTELEGIIRVEVSVQREDAAQAMK